MQLLLDVVLAAHHDLVSTRDLRGSGFDRTMIDQFVDYGRLTRIRRGWYAGPELNPTIRRAVTVGGRLACVSAIALHEGRLPSPQTAPMETLHVAVSRSTRRLYCPDDPRLLLDAERDRIVVHWMPGRPSEHDDNRVVAFNDARRQARGCRALPPGLSIGLRRP